MNTQILLGFTLHAGGFQLSLPYNAQHNQTSLASTAPKEIWTYQFWRLARCLGWRLVVDHRSARLQKPETNRCSCDGIARPIKALHLHVPSHSVLQTRSYFRPVVHRTVPVLLYYRTMVTVQAATALKQYVTNCNNMYIELHSFCRHCIVIVLSLWVYYMCARTHNRGLQQTQ